MTRFLSCAWRHAALGVFVAVLSACGGGGGGGGGGDAPPPPPAGPAADAPNRYLPTDPARMYTYQDQVHVHFEAPSSNNGQTFHSLVYPGNSREYFTTSAEGVGLFGLYMATIRVGDGVDYSGNVLFDNALPLLQGISKTGTVSVSGAGTIDVSPTYGRNELRYSGTVVNSEAPVETAFGLFPARIVDIDLSMTTTVQGQAFKLLYKVKFWFVRDVGIVKREENSVAMPLVDVQGLDDDGDRFLDPYDAFPNDSQRWEITPLYASDDGIAFVSLPSYHRLAQTVTIMHGDAQAPMQWDAVSDKPWLSATQGAGGTLHIAADPTGLDPDTLHYATVTVSSGSAEVAAPARIRVGLWVGSQDAPASATMSTGRQRMVADPLRPFVYINYGASIEVINIYTQAPMGTIILSGPPGSADGPMTLSSDGSMLYVSSAGSIKRVVIDAPGGLQGTWLMASDPGEIGYARPQGRPLILEGNGGVFDDATGQRLEYARWRNPSGWAGNNLVPHTSVLGNRVCGTSVVTGWVGCHTLRFVGHPLPVMRFTSSELRYLDAPGNAFAMSGNGDYLYRVSGDWTMLMEALDAASVTGSPSTLQIRSTPGIARFVGVDADGVVYAGGDGTVVFESDLTQRGTLPLSAQSSEFEVSADGAVLLNLDAGNLVFTRTY